MKDLILQTVNEFLKRHHRIRAPILLGFSGGPDSLALLYLLLQCGRFFSLDLHLAHVDHGWRRESSLQAEELRKLAEALNLPFYLEVLKPDPRKTNLEDKARQARLNFFSKIYREGGFQALLLAHQLNDQSETVLKRILEGAHFFSLGGLQPVSSLNGMQVWRPLLKISKEKLLVWLKKRELFAIEDPTNRELKFLRARMRLQIFPDLEKAFGKKISHHLHDLGESAHQMKDYLVKKVAPYFDRIEKRENGLYLNLNSFYPLESMELKFFFKTFAEKEGMPLSREQLNMLTEHALLKSVRRKVIKKGKTLIVDRGEMFLFQNEELR